MASSNTPNRRPPSTPNASTPTNSILRPPSGHTAGPNSGTPGFHPHIFQSPSSLPNPRFPFQQHASASPQTASGSNPNFSSASAKRPPLKPPLPMMSSMSTPSPAGLSFKSAASAGPASSVDLTPAAKRAAAAAVAKKRKLPDKQLPDRVAALLPESALYTQLLEFESRVDAALHRKKIDIQEALKSPPSVQRTLRIYIFNTFANQPPYPPSAGGKSTEPPSWSLKIIGRILEDGVATDANLHNYPKFSTFFRRVTIALDPSLYPENPMITWENARSVMQQDGFEVKRKGDREFTANIRLEMNYNPEKFKLSLPLMEVLGIETDTRARVIAGIWQYVKAKRLQNQNDPAFFMCDPALRKVFGEDKLKFSMISQKISQHLSPPQPINLEHKIRLSGNGPVGTACYDVLVDVPFPLQKEMAAFLANTEKHKDIETCDEVICASIKKIHEHRRRRAFFLGFSQSPVEFINALIASQSRDLKLSAGEASRNAEKERRADFYNQPWVEDAVIRYLNRKPSSAPGNDAPGGA